MATISDELGAVARHFSGVAASWAECEEASHAADQLTALAKAAGGMCSCDEAGLER